VFGALARYWLNLQARHDLSLVLMVRKRELLAIQPIRAA
jgi:plasmid maintenance system antidote protein VapI